MTSYQISFGDQVPANNMSQVQIQRNGRIKRVRYAVSVYPDGNGTGGIVLQTAVNNPLFVDATGVQLASFVDQAVANCVSVDTATQSRLSVDSLSHTQDVDVPVNLGSVVNVNGTTLGTADAKVSGFIILDVVD